MNSLAAAATSRCFPAGLWKAWALSRGIYLNLDDAWPAPALPLDLVEMRRWGPQLRFSAPSRLIGEFYREAQKELTPFVLYGSGDFHHLTALWVRQVVEPCVLVSFDNHPDWDVRPPRWCCGGWVNRALECPRIRKISVWGCGNFEYWWPGRLFGNRRAEREGRLEIHPWADGRPRSDQARRGAILRSNWQESFAEFVRALDGSNLYITIDLDCLRGEDAITNWESGRFTLADIAWALTQLRAAGAKIVGADMCGAFSPPFYARRKQRLAAAMDHPKLPVPDFAAATKTNLRAFNALWPLLAD